MFVFLIIINFINVILRVCIHHIPITQVANKVKVIFINLFVLNIDGVIIFIVFVSMEKIMVHFFQVTITIDSIIYSFISVYWFNYFATVLNIKLFIFTFISINHYFNYSINFYYPNFNFNKNEIAKEKIIPLYNFLRITLIFKAEQANL